MSSPYGDYLETRILSATPLELVTILYEAALAAVRDARRYLAQGDIPARSRAVTRAVAIVGELAGSLDHAQGGDLSPRLAAIYDYTQRILLDANFRQMDDGLEEAERLLDGLAEAWQQIAMPADGPVPVATAAGEPEWALHQWSA